MFLGVKMSWHYWNAMNDANMAEIWRYDSMIPPHFGIGVLEIVISNILNRPENELNLEAAYFFIVILEGNYFLREFLKLH